MKQPQVTAGTNINEIRDNITTKQNYLREIDTNTFEYLCSLNINPKDYKPMMRNLTKDEIIDSWRFGVFYGNYLGLEISYQT